MNSGDSRLAVLIDGDNFPPDLADALFVEVAKRGRATVRRVYGTSSALNGWRQKAQQHTLGLREVLPGKNAADMTLAIEAMDILHAGKVACFCIASSDSDFAPLAARLREDGATVNGFGESKAADNFRRACDGFVALNKPAKAAQQPIRTEVKPKVEPPPNTRVQHAAVLLRAAMARMAPAGNTIPLSTLAQHVRQIEQGFAVKSYDAKSFKALVLRSGFKLANNGVAPESVVVPKLSAV